MSTVPADLCVIDTVRFHEHEFIDIEYRGARCAIARQFAKALGYKQPNALVKKIRADWSKDFEEGVHYHLLEGIELADFKRLFSELVPDSGTSHAPKLMVLTALGMDMCCVLSSTVVGVELRKYLVTRGIVRAVLKGEDPTTLARRRVDAALHRETRLAKKEDRLCAAFVLALVEKLDIEPDAKLALQLQLVTSVSGLPTSHIAPVTTWSTATEAAKRLGITVQRFGRLRVKAQLNGNIPGLCRVTIGRRQHIEGPCEVTEYTDLAISLVAKQRELELAGGTDVGAA